MVADGAGGDFQATQSRVGGASAGPKNHGRQCTDRLFADWGTGLYGAPAIARSIEGLDHCEVVLDLGDTYYSREDDEIRDRLIGTRPGSLSLGSTSSAVTPRGARP